MKKITTEALVLKNIPFKDADRIYSFFTRDYGKLTALAKGVRKITSRRSGSLDSLNHISLQLTKSNDFNYVTEVQIINSFEEIKKELELNKVGFYIRELLDKFLYEDEDFYKAFDLTISMLTKINSRTKDTQVVVNKYEIKLLQALGYQPPKHILDKWLQAVSNRELNLADSYIKNFVISTLGESLDSLKIV